jgi:hypothetical protein
MNLVGREVESTILDGQVNRATSSFIVIYGRRRVGKTYFVRDYCEQNDLVLLEFTGLYNQQTKKQLQHFIGRLNELELENAIHVPQHWIEAFAMLDKFINKHYANKKVIIFLDEVPWMDSTRSDLISAMGDLWDKRIANNPNKHLIVCGSAASYMLKKITKNKGPLHNRITRKVEMHPFNLHLTKTFFTQNKWQLTDKDICDIYIALGGVAKYLRDLDPHLTPEQAIQDLCFSKNGLLLQEYNELFHSLFNKAKAHYAIMALLVTKWKGASRIEIQEALTFAQSTLSDALNELISAGFVESRPEFKKSKRHERLLVNDMFCFFHHKWIKSKKVTNWSTTKNTQSYRSWSGFAFERICQMHTFQIKKKLGIQGIDTQTHYWEQKGNSSQQGAQIDMLLEHTSGGKNIDIIECKYHNSVFTITKEYHNQLQRKINAFQESTHFKYNVRLILVTANGVTKNQYFNSLNPIDVQLSDMFSAEP